MGVIDSDGTRDGDGVGVGVRVGVIDSDGTRDGDGVGVRVGVIDSDGTRARAGVGSDGAVRSSATNLTASSYPNSPSIDASSFSELRSVP